MEEMRYISANTIRELVERVNKLRIVQSQIVSLTKEDSMWVLIYYDQD